MDAAVSCMKPALFCCSTAPGKGKEALLMQRRQIQRHRGLGHVYTQAFLLVNRNKQHHPSVIFSPAGRSNPRTEPSCRRPIFSPSYSPQWVDLSSLYLPEFADIPLLPSHPSPCRHFIAFPSPPPNRKTASYKQKIIDATTMPRAMDRNTPNKHLVTDVTTAV